MKKTLGFVLLAVILCSALVLGFTTVTHAGYCEDEYESCMAGCGIPGPNNPNHGKCVVGCMQQYDGCTPPIY